MRNGSISSDIMFATLELIGKAFRAIKRLFVCDHDWNTFGQHGTRYKICAHCGKSEWEKSS